MTDDLKELINDVNSLYKDQSFSYDLAQLNSKAMLQELTPEKGQNLTFDIIQFIKNLTIATYSIEKIAQISIDKLEEINKQVLEIAKAWENLIFMKPAMHTTSIINSSILYELAGYQANSSGLIKTIYNKIDHEKTNFNSIVINYLLRRFVNTFKLSKQITDQKGPFTLDELALLVCAKGFLEICKYFLTGNLSAYHNAISLFTKSLEVYSKLHKIHESTIIHGIISILPIMKNKSTWNYFKNKSINDAPEWQKYLKLLARGTGHDLLKGTSISELWKSQIEVLNGNLLEGNNAIIKMPTSAGKTRIAEMAIVHSLIKKRGQKCIFIAPFKSLIDELEQSFSNVFSELNFKISTMFEYYISKDEFQEILAQDSDLLVLTPEKMDMLYRTRPDIIENTSLIIIDEGHILNEGTRGIKFELLINRLKRRYPNLQYIILSAVIPDKTIEDFSEWFDINQHQIVNSSWRPIIQRIASFEWKKNNGDLTYVGSESIKEYVPNIIKKNDYSIIENGLMKKKVFPDGKSKSQTAAELAWKFYELGSVLIFCSQKNYVKSVGTALLQEIRMIEREGNEPYRRVSENNSLSIPIAKNWLGSDHMITNLLEYGIGIHHGSLPDILKRAIESDFKSHKLNILISTNTLGQGVNLPIRTVIIHSCWRQRPIKERISAREYWNIVGRAGRAGEETQGLAIHVIHNDIDKADFRHYLENRTNLEKIESALFSLLKKLSRGILDSNDFIERLDAEMLIMLAEENLTDSQDILSLFNHTLASIQIRKDSNYEYYQNLFLENMIESYDSVRDTINFKYLPVFKKTGLSSDSCIKIANFIIQNQVWVKDFIQVSSIDETIKTLLDFLVDLKEFSYDKDIGIDYFELFQEWMKGENIKSILRKYDDIITPEEISRFIESNFSNTLPWIVSGFTQIFIAVNDIKESEISDYIKFLPAMIKNGVPTPAASWAISLGIPYRHTAIDISNMFEQENFKGYDDFIKYVSRLTIDDLVNVYGLESPLLEEVYKKLIKITSFETSEEIDLPYETFIAGVKYADVSAASRIRIGDTLRLVREYENKVDRNAIRLEYDGKHVGYVGKQLSKAIAFEIDAGLEVNSIVIEVYKEKIPAIKIRIANEN